MYNIRNVIPMIIIRSLPDQILISSDKEMMQFKYRKNSYGF
jgi:hypothetical protein